MANQEWKHELNNAYPAGTRVELEHMDDPYSNMPAGLRGTVSFVDDAGKIHMRWDNGSSLALVPGVDSFRKLPEENTMPEKNKVDQYIDLINENILPHINYPELQKSYNTPGKEYAKSILNRLHEVMIQVYGSDTLKPEYQDYDSDVVVVPGVIQGKKSGQVCLALLDIDLASSGEHCGTSFLCRHGVVQYKDADNLKTINDFIAKNYIPYDYCYTANIPNDIHVGHTRLPEGIKDMLDGVQNLPPEIPVGRIDFLGSNGEVGESVEYMDAELFESDIRKENFYGAPMSVTLYRDADGHTIPHDFIFETDPPLQGFRIEDYVGKQDEDYTNEQDEDDFDMEPD